MYKVRARTTFGVDLGGICAKFWNVFFGILVSFGRFGRIWRGGDLGWVYVGFCGQNFVISQNLNA